MCPTHLAYHFHSVRKESRYCLATRRPSCLVCCDLPMCDLDNEALHDGSSHYISIPIPQLQHSAQTTDCQICHVLFGALHPFISNPDQDSLRQMALVAGESRYGVSVKVVRRNSRTESYSIIFQYDRDQQDGWMAGWLCAATLFLSKDEWSLNVYTTRH